MARGNCAHVSALGREVPGVAGALRFWESRPGCPEGATPLFCSCWVDGPSCGTESSFGGWREPASFPLGIPWHREPGPSWDSLCHPHHTVPSLHRGDAISYARIHQQQKQMDEEKLTGTLEGQAL